MTWVGALLLSMATGCIIVDGGPTEVGYLDACDGVDYVCAAGAGSCTEIQINNWDSMCTVTCAVHSDCGTGASCLDGDTIGAVCYQDCATDSQCDVGFNCYAVEDLDTPGFFYDVCAPDNV